MDRYVDSVFESLKENKIISEKIALHPEESGNFKLNKATKENLEDIKKIDFNIKDLGFKVETLLDKTINRLDRVKEIINAEKERLQDISMLCNDRTDYDNAMPLDNTHFIGDFEYEEGVFSAKTTKSTNVKSKVIDVTGNGYEGNKYVLGVKKYMEETLDTSLRRNITDNNISTY